MGLAGTARERVHAVEIAGPAGRLEGLLHVEEGRTPIGLAVICHPHPLFGGTMHNKVVHRLDRAIFATGRDTLRFNFRGVGVSLGRHDGGTGERDDTRAAIAHLAALHPGLPFVLAGFSFGAEKALAAGLAEPLAAELIAVGATAAINALAGLRGTTKRLLFLHGAEDSVAPYAAIHSTLERLEAPHTVVLIDGADHFFTGPGELDRLAAEVASYLAPRGSAPLGEEG